MTPEEIRAHALTEAVRIGIAWRMESGNDVIALASVFAEFIGPEVLHPLQVAPIVLGVSADPEPQEVGHAEDPWGVACARCMHKAGVHVGSGGCHSVLPGGAYCECTLDAEGASAREVSAE